MRPPPRALVTCIGSMSHWQPEGGGQRQPEHTDRRTRERTTGHKGNCSTDRRASVLPEAPNRRKNPSGSESAAPSELLSAPFPVHTHSDGLPCLFTHARTHKCTHRLRKAPHNPTCIPSRSLNGNVKCDSGISTVLLVSVLFVRLKYRRGGAGK